MKGMNNICSINQKWVREPSPDPFGIPKQIALKGAGYYQIYSGTSSPNWIAGKLMEISTMTPSGIISTSREHIMLAPYGDDPKDQHWIRQGYKY